MGEITFPVQPPEPGQACEVAPEILWARIPLPYAPGHVNAYLVADEDGWVAIDAGLDDATARQAWDRILASDLLGGRPVTRVLITHWHSDHMGLAGWLCDRFGAELLMTESEYLHGLVRTFTPQSAKNEIQRDFFLAHGLGRETTEEWVRSGHRYLEMLHPVPRTFRRLHDGQTIRLGSRNFEVVTAGGHSPETAMLLCREDGLFLCADQIIPRIAPNIAVQPFEPKGEPLGIYLRSLDRLETLVPAGALILPGHDLVYRGSARRITELRAHFRTRCDAIAGACRAPRSVGELLPLLFDRRPGPVWIGFVASDVLSPLHHMVAEGRLARLPRDGTIRFVVPD